MWRTGTVDLIAELGLVFGSGGTDRRGKKRLVGTGQMCLGHW